MKIQSRIVGALLLVCSAAAMAEPAAHDATAREIDAFNTKMRTATLQMDDAAILSLWLDDGVDLLPGSAPMLGKPAIAKFLAQMKPKLAGYKVVVQDQTCHLLDVSEPLATEWCAVHQVVQPPSGNKIEVWGELQLVLRHQADGWKIRSEMFTPAGKP